MTNIPDDDIVVPDESQWEEGTSPYDDPELAQQDLDDLTGIFGLSSYARAGEDAVKWALSKGSWFPTGMCQQFTRMAFNAPSGAASAAACWGQSGNRHETADPNHIPRGVPVFWLGGSRGFGHAAVSLGNGLVRSTDWPYAGQVGTARIADISRAWNQRLVGWREEINGTDVYDPPPPPLPTIDASNVAYAVKHTKRLHRGILLKRAVAKEVGRGRMVMDSPILGKAFRDQYRLVQTKYLKALGRKPTSSKAIDGIPGPGSLEWLGRRHGFRVKP